MSERYELIDAQYAHRTTNATHSATIGQMCAWLDVSTSGFYEWRNRAPSANARRRTRLADKIVEIFDAFDGTYGYRRVHVELLRAGVDVGAELVRDIMRQLGLVACQPRPYKTTTVPGDVDPATPDLVARDFTAVAPGVKLVGDITYLHTWQGWVYLATVIDCFNKEVVGYAMAGHMRAQLVCDAVDMAARNHTLADGCIFHSDRGSQYTSAEFAATLADHNMRPSLGRTGSCYDNALAESFNASLKVERVYRTAYPTRETAVADVAQYIEIFYNHRRIHSALGYRTPHEVRNEHDNLQLAA
ncbi:IS3 family transposase [soil metagenome]